MERALRDLVKDFVKDYLTIKVSFYDTDMSSRGFVSCEFLPFVPAVGDVIRFPCFRKPYIVTKREIDFSEAFSDTIKYNVIINEINTDEDEEV